MAKDHVSKSIWKMVTLRLGHEIEKRFILLVERVVQRKVTRILHFARNVGVQLVRVTASFRVSNKCRFQFMESDQKVDTLLCLIK